LARPDAPGASHPGAGRAGRKGQTPPAVVPKTMENLADLRKRRLSLGIPLGELARSVGRSDATISRIERGQIRPSYELVQRIVGFLEAHEGIASPHLTAGELMNRSLVTVESSIALTEAAQRMEKGGISQVPVLEGDRVTGSLSETGVLRTLAQPNGRRAKVRDVQESPYPQVDGGFPAELLATLLTRYPAVLVTQRGVVCGIVTKTDLIRGLRGTPLRRAPAQP
jgi:predicted transcriptional regulator